MARPKTIQHPTSLTLRLPTEMYEDLLAIAEARRVSVSTVARWALEAFIATEKEETNGINSTEL